MRAGHARGAVSTPYRFGSAELQPDERRLLIDGQPVHLGARAFDVLVVLFERQGHLVPKNELLDLVWPGVVVEENNLQVQISTLRKALGPEAIKTVPGRGYRLMGARAAVDTAAVRTPVPVKPSADSSPGNLPARMQPLIGRDA